MVPVFKEEDDEMSVKTTLFPFGRKVTTKLSLHQIKIYVLQHIPENLHMNYS